jgi:hypothetical protein
MEKDRVRRLISHPDFAEEQDREDGQIVWWGRTGRPSRFR